MISRAVLELSIQKALNRSRDVVLSWPRQSGKSTLAQGFLSRQSHNYFDLEYPPQALRLESPVQTLEALEGLVAVDEVQLKLSLFSLLRVLQRHQTDTANRHSKGSIHMNITKTNHQVNHIDRLRQQFALLGQDTFCRALGGHQVEHILREEVGPYLDQCSKTGQRAR